MTRLLKSRFPALALLITLSLSAPAYAGGPATPTFTKTWTTTRTPTITFTPLPTPNGLHVSGACIINIIAGQDGIPGYSGDGGPASASKMNGPEFIAFDSLGNYYFSDTENSLIRKVDLSGNISLYAGLVTAGVPTYGYNGDGIPANTAALYRPKGMAFDSSDNLYIADTANHRIRKVDKASGIISTIIGNGTGAWSADGVSYANPIAFPSSVIFDAFGAMYYIENASRVRKASGGIVNTFAGTTVNGYNGDGIAATTAQMMPFCIAFSPAWDLYIADGWNDRIRKIDSGGMISTVFGNGVPGSAGVGGPATATQVSETTGVGFDTYGDMYVADQANTRILKMDGTGNSSLVAGATGASSTFGNGGPPALAGLGVGYNFAFDSTGKMYHCSAGCHVIRTVDACGAASPTPTKTRTVSPSVSPSPTPSRTPSATATMTSTKTPTSSATPSRSPSPTLSGTQSKTPSFTASPTRTPSPTTSESPTATPSRTPSGTRTSSATPSSTSSRSPTATHTATKSPTSTATSTPNGSITASPTSSATATQSPSSTRSATMTMSPTASLTPNGSATATPSRTPSATPTASPSKTSTATPSGTSTATATSTVPASASPTMTFTPTMTPTVSTTCCESFTYTPTLSPQVSDTVTPTSTGTPVTAGTLTATPTLNIAIPPTPAPADGPPKLLELTMAPNPVQSDAGTLAYKISGRATRVYVSVYSTAYRQILRQEFTAPGTDGWFQVAVDLQGLPNGVWFVRMSVESASGSGSRTAKFCLTR